jgi:hypothetical protein
VRSATRLDVLLVFLIMLGACSSAPSQDAMDKPSMKNLVFLTRDGCVNTVTMRANLDEALKTLGLPNDYQFIDADTLPASDPRGGYGTPTVLHDGADIFGMEEPAAPDPSPT